MKLKKSTILFNLVILLLAGILINCGWSGDEEPASFFAPETGLKGKRHPIFYAPNSPFYTGTPVPANFDATNEQEWMGYFNHKLPLTAIQFWLNQASTAQAMEFSNYLKGKTKNISDTTLLVYKKYFKKNKKNIAFFTYLNYALLLQQEVKSEWDYYDIIEVDTDLVSHSDSLLKALKEELTHEQSPFISTRYYYQIERLYYRIGRYDDGIKFWKTHDKRLIDNTSYYRYLGYVAANYYKQGAYAESNYLYAVIYDGCELMREAALWSFALREELDWKKSLTYVTDKHMQCVLWQIHGYLNNEVEAISEIYKIDPASTTLTPLLMRAVNMQEEKFINISYNNTYRFNSNPLADIESISLIEKIASSDSTADPALWHLVTTYLKTLMGEYAIASKHLEKVKKQTNLSPLFNNQMHIVELLYDIKTSTAIPQIENADTALEANLVKHFKWIKEHGNDSFLRTSDLLTWCKLYLSDFYEPRNPLIAECFHTFTSTNFYTIENIDQMIAFLERPGKTEFETLYAGCYTFSVKDLQTLKMYLLLYAGHFREAVSMNNQFHLFNKEATDYLYADPFLIHIRDCHDCDAEAIQAHKYNTARIIDTLAWLETEALVHPAQAAETYFSLANCLYNITYYGNSRVFYSFTLSESNYDYDDYGNHHYLIPVFDCRMSESFYKKAMQASANKEFQAKCLFMIAKCRQNLGYGIPDVHFNDEEQNDFDASTRDTVYNQIIQQYSNTEYYKQIIEECGYFRKYVGN